MDRGLCKCCWPRKSVSSDDLVNILVFGVTGMIGGAVASHAVASPWMKVYGLSRQYFTDEKQWPEGVHMLSGNMLSYDAMLEVTQNIDVIFLTTFYWETMNPRIEYVQGRNVVNAAVENKVKHIIYLSCDYHPGINNNGPCNFFESKSKITSYLIYMGLPYTIVRMGFAYENLLNLFRPHPINTKTFALALPMEGVPLNWGCLKDFARCVVHIALRPAHNLNMTYNLSAAYLTVAEVARSLSKHFAPFIFIDPQMTVQDYKELDFMGCVDLAAIFSHYQTQRKWDVRVLTEFVYNVSTLDEWLVKSKEDLMNVLDEQMKENVRIPPLVGTVHPHNSDVSGKVCKTKAIQVYKTWFYFQHAKSTSV